MASSKKGIGRNDLYTAIVGELIDRTAERIVAGGTMFGGASPSAVQLEAAAECPGEHAKRYFGAVAAARSLRRSADLLGIELPSDEWLELRAGEAIGELYAQQIEDAQAYVRAYAAEDGYPGGTEGTDPVGFLCYQRRIEMAEVYGAMFASRSIH